MLILGIDFGKKGGFALVNEAEKIIYKCTMPIREDNEIDITNLENIIDKVLGGMDATWTDVKVYGEKLHAIYGTSAKSTFTFGQDYGAVRAAIEILIEPVELVRAVDWQRRIFTRFELKEVKKKNSNRRDTKVMALHAALKRWPDEIWTASSRHRVLHDGMIDAALIALYGLELENKK